ncbi:hypothetical protein [Sinorhizobium meliloti]|uniref:hypothetical protein n=1 Tax=Rhizobium meliloti TaxID=382 RepID=UPI000B49784A|nr:hypothetical protein [Sinorhizobium meliloti]ASP84752.1 hypothetical protein CDO26_09190 [Sinorhizobium meliloti]MQW25684.1 hypothetical protein [Sinorhizobium meliloti]RVG83260.1 hypothetical protein CN219_18310 [Sinorhizobium meliloti]RVI38064.1 hypothetical protein CN197_06525 [Sinorhizobium meliloti]RVI49474.1 hypothetical protein CN196_00840 [Sinorhizobium meliloti]
MNNAQKKLENKIAAAVITTVANPAVPADAAAAGPIIDAVTSKIAPEIINATNNEPWWQSRVVWGSIVAIAAPLAAPLLSWVIGETVTISAEEQANIAAALAAAGAALGGLFAIYGRFVARKPIRE